jgi:uncharacterized small protein (DUF1192 family)
VDFLAPPDGYAKIRTKRKMPKQRENIMAIDPDELMPKKPKVETVIGEDLSAKSVHELEARIATLEAEIARSKEALRARAATKSAADAIFKR